MKLVTLIKYLTTGLVLFQFETAFSDNSGSTQPKSSVSLRQSPTFKKVMTDLKKSGPTMKDIKSMGPGVTGGGDSCEQNVAYSYSYLLQLIAKDKIPTELFNTKSKADLLKHLQGTHFSFATDLTQGRPVEMVNIPPSNRVVLDRSICEKNYEPLSYYTPLLLHEALRLVGRNDDADYAISKEYVGKIRSEISADMNNKRTFRILSNTAVGTIALAWGMRGKAIDFEKLDSWNQERQSNWIDKNMKDFENYVVDLKKMRILTVIRESGWDECGGECGGIVEPWVEFNEKQSTGLSGMDFDFDPKLRVGVITAEGQWETSITEMFAIGEDQQLLGVCKIDCNDIVQKAAYRMLTQEQQDKLGQFQNATISPVFLGTEGEWHWEITYSGDNYRQSGYVSYKAGMNIKFENGKFKPTIGPFKIVEDIPVDENEE